MRQILSADKIENKAPSTQYRWIINIYTLICLLGFAGSGVMKAIHDVWATPPYWHFMQDSVLMSQHVVWTLLWVACLLVQANTNAPTKPAFATHRLLGRVVVPFAFGGFFVSSIMLMLEQKTSHYLLSLQMTTLFVSAAAFLAGLYFIFRKQMTVHGACMLVAVVASLGPGFYRFLIAVGHAGASSLNLDIDRMVPKSSATLLPAPELAFHEFYFLVTYVTLAIVLFGAFYAVHLLNRYTIAFCLLTFANPFLAATLFSPVMLDYPIGDLIFFSGNEANAS